MMPCLRGRISVAARAALALPALLALLALIPLVVPGAAQVLAGGNRGDVRLWNLADGNELKIVISGDEQ